jgi:hypothetical protein
MTVNRIVTFTFVALLSLETKLVIGQVVPTRAQLNALLGGGGKTENFEKFSVPDNNFIEFSSPLDSTSIKNGQGPGLVVPGIRFAINPGGLQVYGTHVFGGNSQRLSFSATSAYLNTFNPPVTAFGLDLLALQGFSGSPQIAIYDAAHSFLGSFPVGTVGDPIMPTFFGFQHAGGISEFDITVFGGGPILDNVTFGNAVPEPATFPLILVTTLASLAARRRLGNRR